MFVQILKVLTASALVIAIFTLISEREISYKHREDLVSKNVTRVPSIGNRVPEVEPETLKQKYSVAASVPTMSTNVETSPPPLQKESVTPIHNETGNTPKEVVYVSQKEGVSDTDETYHPNLSPCKTAMGFKIGRFDSKFGITKEAFIEEVNNAAQMWANEVGKPVFTYNSQGPLTINLIYDERQARTDSANNLSLEIENSKAHADQLKSIYEKEKEVYIGDTKQLTKDMNAFKERYKVYTDKVTMYNNRGGAQQEEYDAMTKELEFLKQLSKELNSRRDSLIAYRDTINAKVNRYNELVTYINELIEKSNALGGNSFTEGRFTPYSNTIDIYQYNDLVKLRRVIAHELGHVIGIRHVENVASIMYSMNSATTTVLSAQDAAALKSACAQ